MKKTKKRLMREAKKIYAVKPKKPMACKKGSPYVYLPAEQRIYSELFKQPITKKDLKGEIKEGEKNLVLWEKDGKSYLILFEDWVKTNFSNPKAYVSQDKNFKTLIYMIEKNNFNKEKKDTTLVFTLKEYALERGYTEEEIRKSGKFLELLKEDLRWGSYMSYRLDNVEIWGKKYKASGLPPFYVLFEPKDRDNDKWIIQFNEPYRSQILEILYREKKQFFSYPLRELRDRETTNRPILHIFYVVYSKLKQDEKNNQFIKIKNLLIRMGFNEEDLKRPKECYEVLDQCIKYFYNYPDEFKFVLLAKDLKLTNDNWIYINPEKLTYDWIKLISKDKFKVDDWRDLLISFCDEKGLNRLRLGILHRPDENKKNDLDKLIKRVMSWINRNVDWASMREWTKEKTEKVLRDQINRLGIEKVEEFFIKEANDVNPNPIRFIKKLIDLPKDII